MARRTVPRLASDITRGYVAAVIALGPTLPLQFLLIRTIDDLDLPTLTLVSLLIFWSLFSVVFVLLHFIVFAGSSSTELRRWLIATTPKDRGTRIWYLVNGVGAASSATSGSVIAVAAALFLVMNQEFRDEASIIYASIGSVIGSLMVTITAYTVRYAREYVTRGGFSFPGGHEPRFADFFYLAVQISTSFSTDVEIRATKMRNIVTVNSLISFAFNTVIVALLVASLVTSFG